MDMYTVNIREFRRWLRKYLDLADTGNDIMILRNGRQYKVVSYIDKEHDCRYSKVREVSL